MQTFTNKFNTNCCECNQEIEKGEEVTYSGTNEIIHAQCPANINIKSGTQYCPNCFVNLPLSGICTNCD